MILLKHVTGAYSKEGVILRTKSTKRRAGGSGLKHKQQLTRAVPFEKDPAQGLAPAAFVLSISLSNSFSLHAAALPVLVLSTTYTVTRLDVRLAHLAQPANDLRAQLRHLAACLPCPTTTSPTLVRCVILVRAAKKKGRDRWGCYRAF